MNSTGYGDILRSELVNVGISISKPIQEKLALYCSEVARWNVRLNLTGLAGAGLVRRLVLEPVWIAERLQMAGVLVDIGSGNGSPAVPMSLSCLFSETHMVEARSRRAVFLRHIASVLNLTGAAVHKGRFGDVDLNIAPADWVTMQAIAPNKNILQGIRAISKQTTSVVWITSGEAPEAIVPIKASLAVPFSNTRVLFLVMDNV